MTATLIILFWINTYSANAGKEPTDKKKPNIIFILTDDLGYGDLGILFQNQRKAEGKPFHSTPNLDKMAGEGTLLTRHYVPAPVCAPSRASLLLGQHQGHAGVRNNQFDKALPDNHTIASVLREAGYSTALIGKYGLQGTEGNSPDTWEAYPTKRGFDYFFGYVRHKDGHNHYPAHSVAERKPMELYDSNEEISAMLKGCYTTDLFTARAKKYIIDQNTSQPDKPFFMYLAFDTPHAGLEVATSPYPEGGGLSGGLQWQGEKGRYINTAMEPIDSYFHPDYANQNWPVVHKRFASMVRRIDNAVGDLLQLLKDLEIEENTLIVFTSDNGPHHESYGYGEYAPTLFESYANMDGTKRDTWEGGIRVPTIVKWAGIVPAGKENNSPSGFHDWLPTFAQAAGIPAPANTDGVSLLPILKGEKNAFLGNVYIEYSEGRSTPDYPAFHTSHKGEKRGEMQVIYLDGYKGIRYNITAPSDDFRIYDTAKDPGEIHDLAGTDESFNNLQERMKSRVLQLRRPNQTALRPYDDMPIPSSETEKKLQNGLDYKLFDLVTPWTPLIASIAQDATVSGITEDLDLIKIKAKSNSVIEFKGYLRVKETGTYSFGLQTDGGTVMHLHDALIFDADKGNLIGSQSHTEVILEKGDHPIRLVFNSKGNENPSLLLNWSGPGFSEKLIAPSDFFH